MKVFPVLVSVKVRANSEKEAESLAQEEINTQIKLDRDMRVHDEPYMISATAVRSSN